ncbi:MAG TPA: tetratricopeptide repeat protein, partial [Tepidisphaeraceae bacterium]
KAVSSASQLYQIAALMTQLGETAASERILRRSHELDPNHPATCNDLGYMLADEGRELDFAEKLLWRAVGAEPDNPAYVDSLGWLLYKRGKFAEASQYLEQAVQASEPPDAVVLDHAGDAAHRVGQIDRAKQHWKQAVDMLRQRTGHDPQLRLRVEQKLRQLETGADVGVAPAEAK